MTLPQKRPGDWDDIPKAGINYKTSLNMKMDIRRQKESYRWILCLGCFMDAQVGKVLRKLDEQGLRNNTIVILRVTMDTIWENTTSGKKCHCG